MLKTPNPKYKVASKLHLLPLHEALILLGISEKEVRIEHKKDETITISKCDLTGHEYISVLDVAKYLRYKSS